MSDFLFARPSFREGLGRLIDFGGVYEVSTVRKPENADRP